MKIINNDWEFASHWSEAFLEGGESKAVVRLPHTVKEVPLHDVDSILYQMITGYRKRLSFTEEK